MQTRRRDTKISIDFQTFQASLMRMIPLFYVSNFLLKHKVSKFLKDASVQQKSRKILVYTYCLAVISRDFVDQLQR